LNILGANASSMAVNIKTPEQIEGIRRSSRLAAATLDHIEPYIKAGVHTAFLDDKIYQFMRKHGAKPATLNYRGYPKSSCISLNEVVCHGIPSKKTVLKEGDILNIDVTTILEGYFGDTSRMFVVGEPSQRARQLMEVTKRSMDLGIEQCRPGHKTGAIGAAISEYAKKQGYSVVYQYCGHGVGLKFHEEPEICHDAKPSSGVEMKPGMVFTIEPMINEGKARTKVDKRDNWTARTLDNKLSAQYEHTILITETGREVLTDNKEEYAIT
jgi:methionyl aminopeptidase